MIKLFSRKKLINVKPNGKWDKKYEEATFYVKLASAEATVKREPENKKLKRKVKRIKEEIQRKELDFWDLFEDVF